MRIRRRVCHRPSEVDESCDAIGDASPTSVARRAAPTTIYWTTAPDDQDGKTKQIKTRNQIPKIKSTRWTRHGWDFVWRHGENTRRPAGYLQFIFLLHLTTNYKRNRISKYFIVKFLVEANKVTLQAAAETKEESIAFFYILRPAAFQLCGMGNPLVIQTIRSHPNHRATHKQLPFSTSSAVPLFSENNNEKYEFLIRWRSDFNKQNKRWRQNELGNTLRFEFTASFLSIIFVIIEGAISKLENNFQSVAGFSEDNTLFNRRVLKW